MLLLMWHVVFGVMCAVNPMCAMCDLHLAWIRRCFGSVLQSNLCQVQLQFMSTFVKP